MSYITPDKVTSPQDMVDALEVLYDGDEGGWALAKMKWNGKPSIGIRWNGTSDDPKPKCTGNPQSRGLPTWFILPEEIAWMVAAHMQTLSTPGGQNNKSII